MGMLWGTFQSANVAVSDPNVTPTVACGPPQVEVVGVTLIESGYEGQEILRAINRLVRRVTHVRDPSGSLGSTST